jgi:protein-tyrosine phosphatase
MTMKIVSFAALLLALAGPAAHSAPAVHATASAPHQRLLPLQGGRNFRDLGGYPAANGRTVKWGLLFRSGSMHGLTPADYAYLEKRGIRIVCDFRSTQERKAEPSAWPKAAAPRVLADDYSLDGVGMMPNLRAPDLTPEKARASIAAMYPRMLDVFHDQYRRMFAELLAGHAPLAFNCSAGKDRTGVAAALILTALGVPRATVVQDYALTNRYLDTRQLTSPASKATANEAWAKLPPAVLKPLMAADPAYIDSVLDKIDRHPGGVEGFYRNEMGMGPQQIAKLRSLYLEGHPVRS